MRVFRLRITGTKIHFACGRVELVFPDQFIGEGKPVAVKIKAARAFLVIHANQLGNKLNVRYQTNNALRTVAENFLGTAR
jgi:hypothetical protein